MGCAWEMLPDAASALTLRAKEVEDKRADLEAEKERIERAKAAPPIQQCSHDRSAVRGSPWAGARAHEGAFLNDTAGCRAAGAPPI